VETVTKTPEQMGESFAQPNMQERFGTWAERAIKEARQEKKEDKSGSREIDLKGRTDDEREWIEKVAEKDESGKESRRDSSAERESPARTEQRPGGKSGEKPSASESTDSPSEPLSGDRHWQALEGKVVLGKKELDAHWRAVDTRMGVALRYMDQHPQKAQMEEGFRALFAGMPSARGDAFMQNLVTALAEVPNPGEVLRHITVQPEDREFLRRVKDWKGLRAAIQTVSKQYPAPTSQASRKPRAPKPPSEVGGRGSATDDSTRNADNFSSFSESMSRRYTQR
jgi:hypothetical protein